MQRTERRNPGRGLSALALPRRAFDGQRTHWTAAGGRSACGGQAPAHVAQRGRRGPEAACSCKIAFAGMNVLEGAEELRLRALLAHGVLNDGLKLSKIVELNLAGVQR